MIDCWTNFVKTGDPGNGWTPSTEGNRNYMIFNADESRAIYGMGSPKTPVQ